MASFTMAAAIAPAGLVAPLDLSSRTAISGSRASAFVKNSKARTTCSASSVDETTTVAQAAGKFATALALAALVGGSDMVVPEAKADVAGLTPCKESKGFAKREKQEPGLHLLKPRHAGRCHSTVDPTLYSSWNGTSRCPA